MRVLISCQGGRERFYDACAAPDLMVADED
jgi:hypothetical protein